MRAFCFNGMARRLGGGFVMEGWLYKNALHVLTYTFLKVFFIKAKALG